MNLRRYLPSAQFTVIVASLFLSGGLVYAAQYVTHRSQIPARVAVSSQTALDTSWEATLNQIQAQNSATSLVAPSSETVNQLLTNAQDTNVTDSVARTLLVNLSQAKSQGLGNDVPTQDQIIAAAKEQLASVTHTTATSLTLSNLVVVNTTPTTLHTFGNEMIAAMNRHPEASEQAALLAVGLGVDHRDQSKLDTLPAIGKAYADLAKDLAQVAVPQTLTPLYLQFINDYVRIAGTLPDMQTLLTDPLRGLAGLQNYNSLMDETGRVFTQIGSNIKKNGILFNKDEPGNAWNVLVSP